MLADAKMALHYRPLPRSAPGALAAAVDRSSGLSSPEHLLEVLRRDWSIAQRDGRTLTVMRIDVDGCRDYHEVFGRSATDNMLRQVGRTVASAMRRTSDIVARLADDEFLLLGVSMEEGRAREHAENIAGRIRALAIHHPRSRTGRYLTVSVGVVTVVPPRDRPCEALLEAAQRALSGAKDRGGSCVVAGELG
jgi:diguanylate cyclase (GGDEF)-like protein